jgi:uroporphyrinogen decarboxylase
VGEVEGKFVGLYTLGRIREVLPMLVESGVDFIETFETNQGDITLAEAKRLYGDRVCVMGNFDCVVLARGTVAEAREETRRCLEEGMEGGGFVLVTGDEVPADARWDNLKAMVEVAEERGVY